MLVVTVFRGWLQISSAASWFLQGVGENKCPLVPSLIALRFPRIQLPLSFAEDSVYVSREKPQFPVPKQSESA
jgi:hypothetical protein